MRGITNIFLHFLNRDTQEIFGITTSRHTKLDIEKANRELLRLGLNASVLLCDSQHYCVMPLGFWFESKLTRDLMQETAEYSKRGYVRYCLRENSLEEFIEKKREQYFGFQKKKSWERLYEYFFDDEVWKQLVELNPVIIDRNTKIGHYCSEIWNNEHNLLIQQNRGELLSAYSSISNEQTVRLKVAKHVQNVARDPNTPFVWSNVSESISELRIQDKTPAKKLRRFFEKSYYKAYLLEYNASILYNFYYLDKGITFNLGFARNAIANFLWFETFLESLSLRDLLAASAEQIAMVKQSVAWERLLQQYVALCNTEIFQKEPLQRKTICLDAIKKYNLVEYIEGVKGILNMNTQNIYLHEKNPFIDVLIMVATVEEEEAILKDGGWEYQCTANGYGYYHRKEGLSFAVARAIEMGEIAAATATQHFVEQLKPRFLSMAGFCAGREGSVNLGDVFVPVKIYDYDNGGKQLTEDTVLREISLTQLDPLWRQKIERFGSEWRKTITITKPVPYEIQFVGFLKILIENNYSISLESLGSYSQYPDLKQIISKEISCGHIELNDLIISATPAAKKQYIEDYYFKYSNYIEPELKIRMGVLATGNKVQQWGNIFDKLTKQYDRKTSAIDMEGYAVSQVATFQHIPCVIAKGVGDFASDNKSFDNRYVSYAVYSAYRFLVSFFNSLKNQELLGQ